MPPHSRRDPTRIHPGPPDQRWIPHDQFVRQTPETPNWERVKTQIEDLLADDGVSEGTHAFLTSLYEQLEERGSLSEKQVRAVEDVEARRDRHGHKGGF